MQAEQGESFVAICNREDFTAVFLLLLIGDV